MDFANTVVFDTSTAFLNHDISEGVDEISEVDSAGGAVRGSTNSRHLAEP
jgi:hypothetical protein